MDLAPNPLRNRLASGSLVLGTAIFSGAQAIVDVAGAAGLDFVRFDSETAWRRDEGMEHLVRAALLAGLTPIVRVDRDDPHLVRKALEIGAGGIMVPDVRSVEDARALVSAAKFPPLGQRGYSRNCFSAGWGAADGRAWAEWSNREPLIGLVIESERGVAQADAILAVPGVDFVQFGAADFAMSIGLGAPDPKHEAVRLAGRRVSEMAMVTGRWLYESSPREQAGLAGPGLLELASDLAVLQATWRDARSLVRP